MLGLQSDNVYLAPNCLKNNSIVKQLRDNNIAIMATQTGNDAIW